MISCSEICHQRRCASSTPAVQVANAVSITVGGAPATFNSAVLTPGMVGSYQVSVTLPSTLPPGQATVLVGVARQTSPPSTIWIQ